MSLPVLRFNEFSGNWKHLNLGGITKTLTSGSRDWAKYYSKTGSKFIRMTNLSRDGIQLKLDDLKFVNVETDSADGKRTSLVQGDILISITAELGKIGWIPPSFGEAFINQHTALLRLDASKVDSRCVAHILASPKVNKIINSMNDAGAKAGLNLPTIKAIKIYLPEKDEQTKIANFLTAFDEKITQLTQKCELLTLYKKGVMQQIFSQELRFKGDDGQEFPEWNEYLLNDALIKNSSKNKRGEFTLVQSVSNKHGFINQDELFEGRVIASKDLSNYYVIKKSAFAYNPSRIDIGSLAYKDDDLTSVVSPLYVSFYAKPHLIIDRFLLNWFDSDIFKNQMNSSFEGSVRNTLSYDALSKIVIRLPCIKEQEKIAHFLTAIDDKLTHTHDQLVAAKQYKQGLLQQMFV